MHRSGIHSIRAITYLSSIDTLVFKFLLWWVACTADMNDNNFNYTYDTFPHGLVLGPVVPVIIDAN